MKCRDVSIVNHEKKMRWFGSTGAKQSIRPVIPVTVQFEARRNDRYYRVTVKFDISFKLVYNNLASPPQLYAAFHSEYDDASAYITVTSCLVEKKIGIDGTYSSYIHYPATSESSVNGDVLFKNFTADLDDVNASWTPKFNFDCTINDVEYEKNYRNTLHMNCSLDLSRKGNCMDNGIMENFFGRLKVEMFYGENFESPRGFIEKLKEYIHYYNNERISLNLKGMSPVQFRTHSYSV